MSGPKNASIGASGFRFYRWTDPISGEDTDVLSVTSIRRLCGVPHMLVNWQVGNVINLAMGTRQETRIGPKGGVKKVYVQEGDFPGTFVTQMLASNGAEEELARVRKWLNGSSNEPRDTAATRGTVVHSAIEHDVRVDQIDLGYIEKMWQLERTTSRATMQDVMFVQHCMRQYWAMRAGVPFVILAREPQVWNLSAGYAGSFDVLLWLVPEGTPPEQLVAWQVLANQRALSVEDIEAAGGQIVLGDWKTSKGVYVDHVVQVHAYLAAEFVGEDGVVDAYLTRFLKVAERGCLIHIRPNGWGMHFVDFTAPVLRAFLGSVAFARFLAMHQEPTALFTNELTGAAPDTDTEDEDDGY